MTGFNPNASSMTLGMMFASEAAFWPFSFPQCHSQFVFILMTCFVLMTCFMNL